MLPCALQHHPLFILYRHAHTFSHSLSATHCQPYTAMHLQLEGILTLAHEALEQLIMLCNVAMPQQGLP